MPGPAMGRSTFTVDRTSAVLEARRARAKDLQPALEAMGAAMFLSIDENFVQQGRRNDQGHQWPPLAPLTKALRPKGQQANPMVLQLTGDLRRSTQKATNARQLAVGTYDPKAPGQHQGGRWGSSETHLIRRRIKAHTRKTRHGRHRVAAHTQASLAEVPARPVYLFQPSDLARWERIQLAYVHDGRVIGG